LHHLTLGDRCTRAKQAGYKILFVPEAKVWHKVAQSSGGQNSPVEVYFKARNQLLWAHKNGLMRNVFYLAKKLTRFLILSIMSLFNKREKRSQMKARIRGVIDFALGRFGNCPKSVRIP